MVVNHADAALESDQTAVTLLYPDRPPQFIATQSKREIAGQIIARIAELCGAPHG